MDEKLVPQVVNTNPSIFEDLATALASLTTFMQTGNMREPLAVLEHIYSTALREPLCYTDLDALTGQSMSAGDRRSGRGAWLLYNIEGLRVCGVHSLLWHDLKKVYKAPLIDQVARDLNASSHLSPEEMQRLGTKATVIDVLGIKDKEIWLVQTLWQSRLIDSATNDRKFGGKKLFKSRVFNDPVFGGDALMTLFKAEYVMRKAFPDTGVRTLCLVLHQEKPDFELYDVPMPRNRPDQITLKQD